MNTYDENLRTATDETLSQLSQEEEKMEVQKDCAGSNLYYAQGARLTAADKFGEAQKKLTAATALNTQGVRDDNIATNLLASVTSAQTEVATTVTNMSTAAGNVQIASNAIAKLAGDVGAVFNILNAADYGTDVCDLGKNVNNLISITAYNAELASQHSMEASGLTSEIIVGDVKESATRTKTDVKQLLDVTKSELTSATTAREAAAKKLDAASVAEKGAEGLLEDAHSLYLASEQAYNISNNQLNLNLQVSNVTHPLSDAYYKLTESDFEEMKLQNIPTKTIADLKNLTDKVYHSKTEFLEAAKKEVDLNDQDKDLILEDAFKFGPFHVQFSPYEHPFLLKPLLINGANATDDSKIPKTVEDYKIFVVPASRSSIFQLAQSDSLVTGTDPKATSKPFKTVKVDKVEKHKLTEESYLELKDKYSNDKKKLAFLAKNKDKLYDSEEDLKTEFINEEFDSKYVESEAVYNVEIEMDGTVTDSDGNPISLGKSYVVFVLVELTLDYQKYINTFSNLLSVASLNFTLTLKLPEVEKFKWPETSVYELNLQSLVDLAQQEVPDDVLSKLTPMINRKYTKQIFWTTVKDEIGPKDYDTYYKQIHDEAVELQGSKLILTTEGTDSYISTFDNLDTSGQNGKDIVQYRCFFMEKKKSVKNKAGNSVSLFTYDALIHERTCDDPGSGGPSSNNDTAAFFNVPIAENVSDGNYAVATKLDTGVLAKAAKEAAESAKRSEEAAESAEEACKEAEEASKAAEAVKVAEAAVAVDDAEAAEKIAKKAEKAAEDVEKVAEKGLEKAINALQHASTPEAKKAAAAVLKDAETDLKNAEIHLKDAKAKEAAKAAETAKAVETKKTAKIAAENAVKIAEDATIAADEAIASKIMAKDIADTAKDIANQTDKEVKDDAKGKHSGNKLLVEVLLDTTDNFGNPINLEKIITEYSPVILAVANVEGTDLSKYTSALSYPHLEETTVSGEN